MSSGLFQPLSHSIVAELQTYTACDISDALLILKVPGAGFLPDLISFATPADKDEANPRQIRIAPASTAYGIAKDDDGSGHPTANIPEGKHWVDLTEPGTFVVENQPFGQTNAVLGGLMALRMKVIGAVGVIVDGRIRDVDELVENNMTDLHHGTPLIQQVWAKGKSTIGAGAGTKPHAINVPIVMGEVTIHPGDYVFSDPIAGVVVIPRDSLEKVLHLLPRLRDMDDHVKNDIAGGISVHDAFAKHRTNVEW